MTKLRLDKIRFRMKNRLLSFLGPLGLFAAMRFKTRHSPRILMYHRFGTSDAWNRLSAQTFRNQVQYLKKHFDLVTMCNLADQIDASDMKPYQAVITVDDGYADFHDIALPVLRDENVPATFYVTTRFVDQEIWLWPDKLEMILDACDKPAAVKRQKWYEQVDVLLDMTPEERDEYLKDLATKMKAEVPPVPTAEFQACSWGQLQDIADAGIEIGAHTENHSRLTRLDDDMLRAEIANSKAAIERETSGKVTSFCYPNGAPEDYDTRVEGAVRDAEFRTAVAAYHDGRTGEMFSLRRLGVGTDRYDFLKAVSGTPFL